jgi:hypothetical protein
MDWYGAQCNGEWENRYGVSIQSCDNPGWWVKIDLADTLLETRSFAPVKRGEVESLDPQPPWLRCYIEDGVFNGAGDPSTLEEILRVFLDWAEQTDL